MSYVIAVLNPKGGCGKTTLVTNIARALQGEGSVIILDTDPQQTAGDWAEKSPEDYPAVAFVKGASLRKQVPKFRDMFDIVVIDGAASLGEVTAESVRVADLILIPVQPSLPDIWATADLVDAVKTRRMITEGKPDAAFLISRQSANTRMSRGVEIPLKEFGIPVLSSRTSNRVAFAEAISAGMAVTDYEPAGKAAEEIISITQELKEVIHAKV